MVLKGSEWYSSFICSFPQRVPLSSVAETFHSLGKEENMFIDSPASNRKQELGSR